MSRCRTILAGVSLLILPVAASLAGQSGVSDAVFREGLRIADQFHVDAIADRRFTHESYWRAVQPFIQSRALTVADVGQSVQGRALRTVRFGTGPIKVLLWSQMHGDESTSSMALADIFRFFAEGGDNALRTRLASALTIAFIPVLNPDGAERFQRENAAGVDINRDARNLATPEARTLKSVRDAFQPDFGFNLHDQGARTRVGRNGLQAAIALLAPAADVDRSWGPVRTRARQVAATMARNLATEIPGRTAKYDDTFEPRAFGDLMQAWGTSTVLIESGALPDDPEKQKLRRLNVAMILDALDAIATQRYASADIQSYERLPFNAGGGYDVLVQGGMLVLPGRSPMRADIAINYNEAVARRDGRVRDVGDLQAAIAFDTLNASGLFLHPAPEAMTRTGANAWLTIGAIAKFSVRESAEPNSRVRFTIP